MDDDEPVRNDFLINFGMFKQQIVEVVTSFIPTYEIPRMAVTFGFLDPIDDIISTKVLPPKKTRSKLIWRRALELDDEQLISNQTLNAVSNLFYQVVGGSRYTLYLGGPCQIEDHI